MAVKLAIT